MNGLGFMVLGACVLLLLALFTSVYRWLERIGWPVREGPRPGTTIPLSVYEVRPSELLREAFRFNPPTFRARDRERKLREQGPPVTKAPLPEIEVREVFFKEGEPRTFAEYAGQRPVLEQLQDMLKVMVMVGDQRLRPILFTGPPGMGKTLLAKVLTNEMRLALNRPVHFFETFPADLPDVKRLDEIIRRCHNHPGSVLFIDEIHDLTDRHCLKLYLVLEEGRYLFEGDAQPTILNPFTILAGTTDPGTCHPALLRRFDRFHLEPATRSWLEDLLFHRRFPTERGAAALLVSRTYHGGEPWRALKLHHMAETYARARGWDRVTEAAAQAVIDRLKLDEWGLGDRERAVIRSLLTQPKIKNVKGQEIITHYAAAEDAVCTMAGVDRDTYRLEIKPVLFAQRLLMVRGGQALTPLAVERYGHLGRVA